MDIMCIMACKKVQRVVALKMEFSLSSSNLVP